MVSINWLFFRLKNCGKKNYYNINGIKSHFLVASYEVWTLFLEGIKSNNFTKNLGDIWSLSLKVTKSYSYHI